MSTSTVDREAVAREIRVATQRIMVIYFSTGMNRFATLQNDIYRHSVGQVSSSLRKQPRAFNFDKRVRRTPKGKPGSFKHTSAVYHLTDEQLQRVHDFTLLLSDRLYVAERRLGRQLSTDDFVAVWKNVVTINACS